MADLYGEFEDSDDLDEVRFPSLFRLFVRSSRHARHSLVTGNRKRVTTRQRGMLVPKGRSLYPCTIHLFGVALRKR